tara:strand:- start:351 stop:569 length:219 start_codon:yes stop_codon:yes gene_type:complete
MNEILWACVLVYVFKPVDVIGVYQTKEECKYISKQYKNTSCHAVNVSNKKEILQQLEALSIIIKNNENTNNN